MSVKKEYRAAKPFQHSSIAMRFVHVEGREIDFLQGQGFIVVPQNAGILKAKNLQEGQTGVILVKRCELITGLSFDFFNRQFNFAPDVQEDEDGNAVRTEEALVSYIIIEGKINLARVR